MSYHPNSQSQVRRTGRLRDVPAPFWVAASVAVLGFFFHAYYSQISSGSDGYSCSYTDFGALVVASVVVASLGAGWIVHSGRQVSRRIATPLLLVLTLALLVVAGVHVIRGLGIVNNPCDAHPLP